MDRETQSLRKIRTGKPSPYEKYGQGNPVPTKNTDRETQSLRKIRTGKPSPYEKKRTGKPSPYEKKRTGKPSPYEKKRTIRFLRYTIALIHINQLNSQS